MPISKGRAAKAKWKALARIILLSKAFVPTFPAVLELSARLFSEIFPFHIMFDNNMKIKQLGLQIQQMMPDIRNPSIVTEYFEIQYPHSVDLSFENVKKFINTPFVLKLRADKMNKTWVKARPLLEVKGKYL